MLCGTHLRPNGYSHKAFVKRQSLLMLMTILAQTFFTFVGRHFMSFVLFTVWHNFVIYLVIILKVLRSYQLV